MLKKNKIIIFLVIILLGISGSFGYYIYNNIHYTRFDEELSAMKGNLPGKSQEEIEQILNQKVDDGMLNIGINTKPEFANGESAGNIMIENIEANNYPFKVDIYLDDENKSIASTKLISPGYYLKDIKLNRNLKEGIYPANALFTSYYSDQENDVCGQTKVKIDIVIKE